MREHNMFEFEHSLSGYPVHNLHIKKEERGLILNFVLILPGFGSPFKMLLYFVHFIILAFEIGNVAQFKEEKLYYPKANIDCHFN